MQKVVSQSSQPCDTIEQITVNRADMKRLHDNYLAQIHILRELLKLPPLITAHKRQMEIAKKHR